MQKNISWKIPTLAKGVDAASAHKVLQRLESITKESVLQEAENPESVLHPLFEWDDSEAAHKYRLVQAGTLINNFEIVVVANDEEKIISAYEIVTTPDQGRVYKEISSLSYDESEEVRARTIAELNYLKNKLSVFDKFLPATKKISEAVELLDVA